METFSFNFANLSLYQAVSQIVAQENLDFGRVYNNFLVCCKEGFFALSLVVDKDGEWTYTANEMDGDPVLVGITVIHDGDVEYHEEILTRKKFDELKTTACGNPIYDEDGICLECIKYEDLLANW